MVSMTKCLSSLQLVRSFIFVISFAEHFLASLLLIQMIFEVFNKYSVLLNTYKPCIPLIPTLLPKS